jgi:hypothetical protein
MPNSNPFLLDKSVILTPIQYMERYLDYAFWNREHPVQSTDVCNEIGHHKVMLEGMCCLEHIKYYSEFKLFELSGCKAGVFVEPRGFRNWLFMADKRKRELENGIDSFEEWATFLDENDRLLNGWMWNYKSDEERNLRPGFTLHGYLVACKKYNIQLNFEKIAKAFGTTQAAVVNCWTDKV